MEKEEVKYLYRKPMKPPPKRVTRPAWKHKEKKKLCSPALMALLLQEKEESIMESVKCSEEKVDSTIQSHGSVYSSSSALERANVDSTMQSSCSVDSSSSLLERAHDVQNNLVSEFPSFVKKMLQSHVIRGFWLGIPKPFCQKHLPKRDATVVLVDEKDVEYTTNYLADRNGLSGGWRSFTLAHDLPEGSVLVFQLIEECKFKVYIVRASGQTKMDSEAKLIAKTIYMPEDEEVCEVAIVSPDDPEVSADQLGNEDNDNLGFDIVKISRFSGSANNDVKSSGTFKVDMNGVVIDSELPEQIRKKYYQLCCSQNCYLHEYIRTTLPNIKMVAGLIIETINVADAISDAKIITSFEDLATWDKTLKFLEDFGMTVGFLRDRLMKLANISYEQRKELETDT